jgi:hypothetical protein
MQRVEPSHGIGFGRFARLGLEQVEAVDQVPIGLPVRICSTFGGERIGHLDAVHDREIHPTVRDVDLGRSRACVDPVDDPGQFAALEQHVAGVVVAMDQALRPGRRGAGADLDGCPPHLRDRRPARHDPFGGREVRREHRQPGGCGEPVQWRKGTGENAEAFRRCVGQVGVARQHAHQDGRTTAELACLVDRDESRRDDCGSGEDLQCDRFARCDIGLAGQPVVLGVQAQHPAGSVVEFEEQHAGGCRPGKLPRADERRAACVAYPAADGF